MALRKVNVKFDIALHAGSGQTDGRMDGRSRDNQISRIYRLPFFLIHVAPLQALCARENSISLTAECER